MAVVVVPMAADAPALATPPSGLVGRFSTNASCVVIGPNHIITTRHQGGGVGSTVWIDGTAYRVAGEDDHPTADIRVCRLVNSAGGVANLRAWAGLYTGSDEVSQTAVIGGFGMTRGADLATGGLTYAYQWAGTSNTTQTWGQNAVDGASPSSLFQPTALISAYFDPPASAAAVPFESAIATWDSGGGWFVQSGGSWLVMGLNHTASVTGRSYFAIPGDPTIAQPEYFDAVRVSAYVSWITGGQTAPNMVVPGDANYDGGVDDNDLGILLGHWMLRAGWGAGDFTGDGVVNDNDLGILLANMVAMPSVSAPEPASMAIILLAGMRLVWRANGSGRIRRSARMLHAPRIRSLRTLLPPFQHRQAAQGQQ